MKVTLNLAASHSSYQRYALAWGIPTVVLGLLVAIFLGSSAVSSSRDYLRARRERLDLQQKEARLVEKESMLRQALEQPRVQEVSRKVRFINAAIEKRRISVTGITDEVTKFLPKGVRMTSLALAPSEKNLRVQFVLSAGSETALEDFLIKLEDSADFKDVAIANQSFDESGSPGAPVRLTCTARYVPPVQKP